MQTRIRRTIRRQIARTITQLEPLESRVLLSTTATSLSPAVGFFAPASPTLISAVALSSSSVQINWVLNSANESGVAVKKWSGSAWFSIAVLPSASTVFVDTGLARNSTYFYTVSAFNSVNESWAATYLPVTTSNASPPAQPTNVSAHTLSSTSVQVSWTLNDSSDTGDYLMRWNGSTWASIATLPAGTQTAIDTGLTPGVVYYYDVVAFNDGGATWADNYASAITLGAPAAPTNLTATALNSSAIQVNWTLHGDESSVYVERWNGISWSPVAQLPLGTTTYVDTGLSSNSVYYYEVVAVNALGSTWAASYVSVATSSPMPPAAPTNLSAMAIDSATIQLNWTLGDFSDTGVDVAKWNGANWQIVAALNAGSTVYLDTFANIGVNYYEVIAINPFGSTWATFYTSAIL